MARNQSGLETTAALLSEVGATKTFIYTLDNEQPDPEEYRRVIKDALTQYGESVQSFERAIIVHNAGSLGPQDRLASEFKDLDEMTRYFTNNLFSAMILTSVCQEEIFSQGPKAFVINISSLAAVQPVSSWSFYCISKASRNMYFQCLANESPEVRVLNYAPGPLDTDMVSNLLADPQCHPDIQKMFAELKSQNNILAPQTSAEKLIAIIQADQFKSGAHVLISGGPCPGYPDLIAALCGISSVSSTDISRPGTLY
eukprot:snap_masked-scaffold438_size171652-processed-gene-0.21 protein:Tk03140 transcript:snap_masked-scaffold438_size171652-processed-gene-0.21-mRNA-1 annotation:"sepiapterin reductase"